jgi:MYXO-CTERM domain-containing protein
VDLQSSAQHCGTCDNACNPGEECIAGVCVQPTYTISGTVRNKKNGQGLSGVILIMDSQRETSSAANGAYIFADVAAGNHTLVAGADGFKTETVQVVVADADLVLDIELTPKPDEGCGCSAGTPANGGLLLLILMMVLRRRFYRTAT